MKNYSVEDYAKKILVDAGCDEYTYGGEFSKYVLRDLKEAFPNGMEFPYVDVANAILAISRARPIKRAPWLMVWDTDSCCDDIECESFEQAKGEAEDTLIIWMCDERDTWKDVFIPTEEELENYNYMIYNCSVRVDKYNPDTDEYEEYWEPSYEDEELIGWKELTMDDIAKEKELIEE